MSYDFRVRAVNSVGEALWSNIDSVIFAEEPPAEEPPAASSDYDFRVRAVNSIGEGPWSNVETVSFIEEPPPTTFPYLPKIGTSNVARVYVGATRLF